jgi:raffinose/stachyose/melibiose transport system permease protein
MRNGDPRGCARADVRSIIANAVWCSTVKRVVTAGNLVRTRSSIAYYAFVLPALAVSLCIVVTPGLLTLLASFTDWDGVSRPSWVGLGNFADLLSDELLWRAVLNNVQWVLVFLTIPMAIGLTAAAILANRKKSQTLFQVILLLPYVLSPIANAMIWQNILLDPVSGVLGFIDRNLFALQNPLTSTSTALYAVAAVDIWHFWGYLAIVFFAAMRQTPLEQLQAAYLEGASSWQIFWNVTLPNIRPTIMLMFVMVTIFSFLTFDYIFLLTRGGPAHSTEMLSTLAYTFAFTTFEAGKAAAVAVIMGFFGLLASIVYVSASNRSLKA